MDDPKSCGEKFRKTNIDAVNVSAIRVIRWRCQNRRGDFAFIVAEILADRRGVADKKVVTYVAGFIAEDKCAAKLQINVYSSSITVTLAFTALSAIGKSPKTISLPLVRELIATTVPSALKIVL